MVKRVIYGGAGNDVISNQFGNGNVNVSGASGNDTIYTGSGNDTVDGGTGNDYVDLGAGDDTAIWFNRSGLDCYVGGAGEDILVIDFADNAEFAAATDYIYSVLGARFEKLKAGQSVSGTFNGLTFSGFESLQYHGEGKAGGVFLRTGCRWRGRCCLL